jgi:hypothetical protein
MKDSEKRETETGIWPFSTFSSNVELAAFVLQLVDAVERASAHKISRNLFRQNFCF